ncbi:MAG: hypothetical protein E5X67_21345 [Mesorhizobium sp.]|uniref:hypothetical protein n=1 Tax=Mesorhizobium sp. TaxID=1871066 RepID=UPI00120869BF|nr:hypothetical protein [Mesorhizobium sp.]TIP26211.1 MAG: hypothetical protein E5X67_21345 [Mesorhizobium sp.]
MTENLDRMTSDPLDATPNPTKAARCCRKLIRAYLENPEYVEWEDVQQALYDALDAFGLAPDYIEMERRT